MSTKIKNKFIPYFTFNDSNSPYRDNYPQECRELLLEQDLDDLTREIYLILYLEWDPIGVHHIQNMAYFDEYCRDVPRIVDMVRNGDSVAAISDQLMVYESYIYGDDNIRKRCDVIAVMVSSYGPHYAKNPFVPTVNTDTPDNAYQSVLNLITQTRLDAYADQWQVVCQGYEKAIEICSTYLPERTSLLGACLNNLGHAYTQLGQLAKAQEQFEKALPNVQYAELKKIYLYEACLDNLINNLEHRREFGAAMPYARALVAYFVAQDSHQLFDAQRRLSKISIPKRRRVCPPVALCCGRAPAEWIE